MLEKNLKLIDTHAHIYDKKYKDIDKVIENSLKNGIFKIFMPNIDLNSLEPSLQISKKYPGICYPMLGLHPCDIDKNYINILLKLEENINKHNFIAIGEIGLDFYKNEDNAELQKKAFKIQLKWAKNKSLPIVLHCRNAFEEIIEILKSEYKGQKIDGIFHCFSGTVEEAKEIINLGMFLGIGGILTFKNAILKKTLKDVDIENIVLETDSPYLAPTPFRGKINLPEYLIYIAEALADLKNMSIYDVAKITTENALSFL